MERIYGGMEKPNICLLVLDTLRKDIFDKFAPHLQAQANITFENMRSLSSWTVPSHAGILTGSVPSKSGCHAYEHNFSRGDFSSDDIFISDLHNKGYRTVGISANIYASSAFDFDQYFNDFHSISPKQFYFDGIDPSNSYHKYNSRIESIIGSTKEALFHDNPSKSLANGAIAGLQSITESLPISSLFDDGVSTLSKGIIQNSSASEPFFMFANLMDIHGPHSLHTKLDHSLISCPPAFSTDDFNHWEVIVDESGLSGHENEVKWWRELYKAQVKYIDEVLSKTIERVNKNTNNQTIFIITSDHGENLGHKQDDYLVHHLSSVTDSLLHVPFIIINARCNENTIIDGLTSHADLPRLIRTMSESGMNLEFTRYIRESAPSEIVGAGTNLPDWVDTDWWDRGQRVIFTNRGNKYYMDQLGNREIKGDSTEFKENLFDIFPSWIDNNGKKTQMNTHTKEQLQDLGYIN